VSDFADLCLAPPRASSIASSHSSRRGPRSPQLPNTVVEPTSASIGIVNSILIGALFWIGVFAAITLT
jgi:hypothetical protein